MLTVVQQPLTLFGHWRKTRSGGYFDGRCYYWCKTGSMARLKTRWRHEKRL